MIANDNLMIYQGNSLGWTFNVTGPDGSPKDWTGYTAKMQVRLNADSPTKIVDLTTENGGINLQAAGLLNLIMTPEQTLALDFTGAKAGSLAVNGTTYTGLIAEYDIQVINVGADTAVTLERGQVVFMKGITK